MDYFLEEIRRERLRQFDKWGNQSRPNPHWAAILMEEVGEACQEVCTLDINCGYIPSNTRDRLRKELVQVAAVCVAWLEDLG